jgi:hypothetical protein
MEFHISLGKGLEFFIADLRLLAGLLRRLPLQGMRRNLALRVSRLMARLLRGYVYSDRDGVGIQDPAIRAYGSRFVGQECELAGPWWRGKALVRFRDGTEVVVRARLLRRIR